MKYNFNVAPKWKFGHVFKRICKHFVKVVFSPGSTAEEDKDLLSICKQIEGRAQVKKGSQNEIMLTCVKEDR